MPRHANYIPLNKGDIIGDLKLLNSYRDIKNNRKMFNTCCVKCGKFREVSEQNLKKHPESYVHENICGYGTRTKLDPKFYDVWAHMKDRIYNPNNPNYAYYGGRGLTTDYDSYEDFEQDMYVSYCKFKLMYPGKKITIDRIDNNLGYVRDNIRWATVTTQSRNSRMVYEFLAIAPNGQRYLSNNQLAFAANHGLEAKHISDCIRGLQQTTGGGWRFVRLDDFRKGPNLFYFDYHNDPFTIKELYY